jgi:L-Ala-D/L-Glu epimerase
MSQRMERVVLRRLRLPLKAPYRLSYRTFLEFEPILVEACDANGVVGWGEGHISPGSSAETREGGWAFCQAVAPELTGRPVPEGKAVVAARIQDSPVAATALLTALEMLEGHPVLRRREPATVPLSTPVNGLEPEEIAAEIEGKLAAGFGTFKVKVGEDVAADAERLTWVQKVVKDRARLRVDANRGFTLEQALAFARAVDWTGIELFEQPCKAEDWEANGAVAETCPAPVMLDEPICGMADVERAASMPGIGYCKVKLKRFGGLDPLLRAIERAKELGLKVVLGDGLSGDIGCWMEACAAAVTLDTAGEFNGFLKARERLLANPFVVEQARVLLPADYWPMLDRERLAAATVAELAV